TRGGYAGAIIFLIVFTVVYRGLAAWGGILERKFAHRERSRVVVIAGNDAAGAKDEKEPAAVTEGTNSGSSSEGEKSESPTPVAKKSWTIPWRFSTEVPRAALSAVTAGVGYLLMLAVMTMNVGYFMAVIGGYFLGDLAFGRYIHAEHH